MRNTFLKEKTISGKNKQTNKDIFYSDFYNTHMPILITK